MYRLIVIDRLWANSRPVLLPAGIRFSYLEVAQVARFQQNEATLLPSLLGHLPETASSLLQVSGHDKVVLRGRNRDIRVVLRGGCQSKESVHTGCLELSSFEHSGSSNKGRSAARGKYRNTLCRRNTGQASLTVSQHPFFRDIESAMGLGGEASNSTVGLGCRVTRGDRRYVVV